MANAEEEVKIKIGVDKRSLVRDLTSVEQHFKNTVLKMGKDLIKLNLASLIGGNFMDVWDKATQKIASMVYAVGTLSDAGRKYWRGEFKNYLAAVEAEKQLEATRAKARDDRDKTLGEAAKVDQQRALLAEKDETKRAAMQKKFLTDELKALRESLDVRGDIVEQSKVQLAIAQKEFELAQLDNASAERKLALTKAIADAEKGVGAAEGNLGAGLRALSDTSLGEANAITESALGAQNLPALKLSRRQMEDIRKANLLERQAKQARINGNDKLADDLSKKRLKLLNDNPWLSEMDRNPLKVAEEQLRTAQEMLALAQNNGLAVKVKVTKR